MRYYEIAYTDSGEFPITAACDTLDEAIELAEAHNVNLISEIGGNWDEWQKCWFCGEWYTTDEFLHDNDTCKRCAVAIESHGG